MQENWSVPLAHVTGSAESDLCMCANVRKKPDREELSVRKRNREVWASLSSVCVCVCVLLFVSGLEMKLGHSL